jgi:hypothetical protein
VFFFEKKNQSTFVCLDLRKASENALINQSKGAKVFGSFF